MLWTIFAFIAWVILGGFIAYYGDLQGRRWGKKRMSLFGLRPRHTAILLTSLTGGAIALFSVVGVLVLVKPVRDAILHGEQAIRENHLLIDRQKQERRKYDAALRESKANVIVAQKRVQEVAKSLQVLQTQLTVAENQVRATRQRNTELTQLNTELSSQRTSLKAESAGLTARLTQARAELKAQTNLRDQLRIQVASMQNQYREAQKLNHDIAQQNVRLVRQNSGLDRRAAELKGRVARLAQSIGQLGDYNTNLTTEKSSLAFENTALRERQVILRSGVELARKVIPAHLAENEAAARVVSLLSMANQAARQMGAREGANGYAVRLIGSSALGGRLAAASDLIRQLTGNYQPIIIIARVAYNTMPYEQAIIRIFPYELKPVFTRGQVIASVRIDSQLATAALVNSVEQFLQHDVTPVAEGAGMVAHVDPATGRPTVLEFRQADMVDLVSRLHQQKGVVRLTASAADSVTAADTLALNFAVEPVAAL